jgi:hypothetical protein
LFSAVRVVRPSTSFGLPSANAAVTTKGGLRLRLRGLLGLGLVLRGLE